MGEIINLKCADGTSISAYRAAPSGVPKGGLIVAQEIFGVNHHIRSVVDRYAAQGYLAIAPALFDRSEANVELSYTAEDLPRGMKLAMGKKSADTMQELAAARDAVASTGRVGIVGYCWGGTLAFAAACHLPGIAAGVAYYGGNIAGMAQEKPKVPLMLHFGSKDANIPLSDVEKIRAAQPQAQIFVYDADHGFNCDERASFDAPSANEALARTLEFFDKNLAST